MWKIRFILYFTEQHCVLIIIHIKHIKVIKKINGKCEFILIIWFTDSTFLCFEWLL